MADPGTGTTIVSWLPLLEPMAGAALAINLAYVNLERFRYRKDIRDCARQELEKVNHVRQELEKVNHVRQELERIKDNKIGKHWHNSQLYQDVLRLAALPDNDPIASDEMEKEGQEKLEQKRRFEMPGGLWGNIYEILFHKHQDRIISYILVLLSLAAFFLGTAHSVNHLTYFESFFSEDYIVYYLYILLVCILSPIFFVYLGHRVVSWGKKVAKKNVAELQKLMQGEAEEILKESQKHIAGLEQSQSDRKIP